MELSQWADNLAQLPDDDVLPPHFPTCLGCGPDAQQGFHLQVAREDGDIVAAYTFQDRHSGAPAIAHGGAVATVVDDLLGFVLFAVREPAVTRRLEIDYVQPVLVGVRYDLRARLDRRDGRKVWVSCEARDPDGQLAFSGVGLFVVVGLEHFTAVGGRSPVVPYVVVSGQLVPGGLGSFGIADRSVALPLEDVLGLEVAGGLLGDLLGELLVVEALPGCGGRAEFGRRGGAGLVGRLLAH